MEQEKLTSGQVTSVMTRALEQGNNFTFRKLDDASTKRQVDEKLSGIMHEILNTRSLTLSAVHGHISQLTMSGRRVNNQDVLKVAKQLIQAPENLNEVLRELRPGQVSDIVAEVIFMIDDVDAHVNSLLMSGKQRSTEENPVKGAVSRALHDTEFSGFRSNDNSVFKGEVLRQAQDGHRRIADNLLREEMLLKFEPPADDDSNKEMSFCSVVDIFNGRFNQLLAGKFKGTIIAVPSLNMGGRGLYFYVIRPRDFGQPIATVKIGDVSGYKSEDMVMFVLRAEGDEDVVLDVYKVDSYPAGIQLKNCSLDNDPMP